MSALGIKTQESFEAWYESYLQGREQILFDIDGFEWDEAQIGFQYSMGEVTDTVTAMATILDLYSPAVAHGREVPIKKIEGYIPRQKRYETLDENDYRTMMQQVADISSAATLRGESPYDNILDFLSKNLLEFGGDFPLSHAQSVTYQVGQMKSNFGLSLTDVNNPNGLVDITFSAKVSASNTLAGKYYTVKANGTVTYDANTHPIQDINTLLNKITWGNKYGEVEAEIDDQTLLWLMGHPDFVRAIGYMTVENLITSSASKADADARALEIGAHRLLIDGSNTEIMSALFKRLFPKVSILKLHDNFVAVAKLNKETKKIEKPLLKVFNEHVLLFRPAGLIGVIKNVVPVRPDSSHLHSYMFDKRGVIDYWYDPNTQTQHWRSELTALATPNRPSKMYRILLGETDSTSIDTEITT